MSLYCRFFFTVNDREVGMKNPGARGELEAELVGISATDPRVLMDWLHSLCGGEAKRH
jgi:hypothetical protein